MLHLCGVLASAGGALNPANGRGDTLSSTPIQGSPLQAAGYKFNAYPLDSGSKLCYTFLAKKGGNLL